MASWFLFSLGQTRHGRLANYSLSLGGYALLEDDFRGPESRRWRATSNSTTPAATETLSERTGPVVGIETRKSQRLRVNSCRPSPSPPSTIPTEPLRSTSV